VTCAVMDGSNSTPCWGPPVRFRDCGHQSPDQAPSAQEQQQLDKRTLEFPYRAANTGAGSKQYPGLLRKVHQRFVGLRVAVSVTYQTVS
jgi:hypothetical protein